MPTASFKIVLQEGIEGGFAPSTPNALYILTRDRNSDIFAVSKHVRPHGTPQLVPLTTRELNVADHAASIDRLQEILSSIPTQHIGAQDLYGRNMSMLQVTDQNLVSTLEVSGSQAGVGIPPPTEEQKAKFNEAVTIIESFGT